METYNFFALAARMKYIHRWGLMKNTSAENVQQHSFDVAVISHALAVIGNTLFDKNYNADRIAVIAMYHDISEIFTGDLPTPVKYQNSEIISAFKDIEHAAKNKILKKLPENMRSTYKDIFDGESGEYGKLVKAADKISAYIKCIEESSSGNSEFKSAETTLKASIEKMNMPEADYFMKHFVPAYYLTLDEI